MRWLSHSHWLEDSYTNESELSLLNTWPTQEKAQREDARDHPYNCLRFKGQSQKKVPEGICSFARAVDAASLSAPWDGNVAQRWILSPQAKELRFLAVRNGSHSVEKNCSKNWTEIRMYSLWKKKDLNTKRWF